MQAYPKTVRACLYAVLVLGLVIAYGWVRPSLSQTGAARDPNQTQPQQAAPASGYLESHKSVQQPFEILGGPIRVSVRRPSGAAQLALPDYRRLDPRVFGTPDLPQACGGTPLMCGIPIDWRAQENGKYTTLRRPSPFGDELTALRNAKFTLEAVDATATDAATTRDSVRFEASWEDSQGNTYTVRCDKVLPYGVEHPVFGGVVTNHILYGFTRIGSPLLPTEFAYVAFWGTGETLKNGTVTDTPVLVHGMLTEMIRVDGRKLAMDDQVTPTRRYFHVLVPAFLPAKDNRSYTPHDVRTGFLLADGRELPFWHVMFENPEIDSRRVEPTTPEQPASTVLRGGNDSTDQAEEENPGENVVGMTELEFTPRQITIKVGQTVTWKNTSETLHTVTADPKLAQNPNHVQLPEGVAPFNSGDLPPGATFRYTFRIPGMYQYFCILHEYAGMIGKVEVQEQR